jgi:hypothetical protein
MFKRSNIVKGSLSLLGILSFGMLINLPANAQSSSEEGTVAPFELSREGMRILCERTPYNSRCTGESADSQMSPSQRQDVNSPARGLPAGEDPLEPGTTDSTTAPTENLPSESEVPSSGTNREALRDRDRQDSYREGETRNQDEIRPDDTYRTPTDDASPGSRDDLNSPDSGTTAPTENLPSESTPPSSR